MSLTVISDGLGQIARGAVNPAKCPERSIPMFCWRIMKAHAHGIDVLRRGDADPRCVLGVTVAKAQAQVA